MTWKGLSPQIKNSRTKAKCGYCCPAVKPMTSEKEKSNSVAKTKKLPTKSVVTGDNPKTPRKFLAAAKKSKNEDCYSYEGEKNSFSDHCIESNVSIGSKFFIESNLHQ